MSNLENIKVSIVIPVYNVESYIIQCLDSVLNQTYQNIEIIIINDGSNDNTLNIINEKYVHHEKIFYYYQSNAGLGAARNKGIELCTGDYILFVDSDDWIREDTVELIVQTLQKDESDAVIFNMSYIFEDGIERKRTPLIMKSECVNNVEALKEEMIGNKFRFHAPNKVCRRSVYMENNIRFPVGKLYEDVATTYKVLLNVSKVSLISDKLYFYRQKRIGSITNSLNERQFVDMLDALDGIINNRELEELSFDEEIQALYVKNIISLSNYIYSAYFGKEDWMKFYEILLKDSNWKLMNNVLSNKYLTNVDKIRCILIKRNIKLYCHTLRLVKR